MSSREDSEQFLVQLRQAGKLESQGTFTLNPVRDFSGLKLFEKSSDCLLCLVQAASTQLEVFLQTHQVRLAFDPAEPRLAAQLLEQMANPDANWSHLCSSAGRSPRI